MFKRKEVDVTWCYVSWLLRDLPVSDFRCTKEKHQCSQTWCWDVWFCFTRRPSKSFEIHEMDRMHSELLRHRCRCILKFHIWSPRGRESTLYIIIFNIPLVRQPQLIEVYYKYIGKFQAMEQKTSGLAGNSWVINSRLSRNSYLKKIAS